MTTIEIITLTLTCTAALIAIAGAITSHRAAREARAATRTFPIGDGVITFNRRMSDADVAKFKARWHETYGKPEQACPTYQPPTTSEDSGLCARCGMYDYKHQEAAGA